MSLHPSLIKYTLLYIKHLYLLFCLRAQTLFVRFIYRMYWTFDTPCSEVCCREIWHNFPRRLSTPDVQGWIVNWPTNISSLLFGLTIFHRDSSSFFYNLVIKNSLDFTLSYIVLFGEKKPRQRWELNVATKYDEDFEPQKRLGSLIDPLGDSRDWQK